ncbi:MAG: hypothetical protein RL385_1681 [Pseudomonadota bacterium]
MAASMGSARKREGKAKLQRAIASLLCCLCCLAGASQVRADERVDLTLARALFEEGVTLAEADDWASAADRFERAYAIKPTAGVAYNWSSALAAMGQLVHASELLDRTLREGIADPALKQECDTLQASILPRLARLRVSIPEPVSTSTELRVDGHVWPRPAWGASSPMDPGQHLAVRLEAGREVARMNVQLGEGEARALDLVATSKGKHIVAPPPVELGPAQHKESAPVDRRPLYKNPWVWAGMGAVIVAGIVITAVSTTGGSAGSEPPAQGNTGEGVIRW